MITGDKEVVIVGGGIGIVSASAGDRLVIVEDIIEVGMVGLGLPGGNIRDFIPVNEAVAAVSGGGKVDAMLCRLKALDRKGVWSIGAGSTAHERGGGDRNAAGIWEIKGSGGGVAVDGDTLGIVHNPLVFVIAVVGGIATRGASKVVVDGFPIFFVGVLSIGQGAVSGSRTTVAENFHVDIWAGAGLEVAIDDGAAIVDFDEARDVDVVLNNRND